MATVWNTLSAGLHIVQEKLDHVLEGEETPNEDQPTNPEPQNTDIEKSSTMIDQPGSPQKPLSSKADSVEEKESLRQALVESEQQTQLINNEYRRLLKEKEAEIKSLKDEVSQLKSSPQSVSSQLSQTQMVPSLLEVAQKELAAHKEMVRELRQQLTEKEEEFQELNSKAETKFNRLKVQAKTKIGNLNKEVEVLKAGKEGVDSSSTSAVSLDDSLNSSLLAPVMESLQVELASLKEDIKSKDKVQGSLEEQMKVLSEEKDKLTKELISIRDKLNVAEVCLQKEKEQSVKLDLLVTELEEQVGQVSDELAVSQDQCKRALQESDKQREANQALQTEVEELWSRREESGDRQSMSSVSPGLQESKEEVDGVEVSPVLAAGERGSLLDLEAEVIRLEASLQERDCQLSSFKSILEEKNVLLDQVQKVNQDFAAKLEQIEKEQKEEAVELNIRLGNCNETLQKYENELSSLRDAHTDTLSQNTSLESRVTLLSEQIGELKESLSQTEVSCSRYKTEISVLNTHLESQRNQITQNEEELSQKVLEIDGLQQTVQEVQTTYRSLQSNMSSDRQSNADKLTSSLKQIEDLERRVVELQEGLDTKEQEVIKLALANHQLEERLALTTESLQQTKDSSLRDRDDHEVSHRQEIAEKERVIREMEESGKQQAALAEDKMNAAFTSLSQTETKLSESEAKIEKLLVANESQKKQILEVEERCSRTTGALEFAQQELVNRNETIKGLSQALDGKATALSRLESEMAHVKSESADKMSEIMQRSEQVLQSRSGLEHSLADTTRSLESKERELACDKETLDQFEKESKSMKEELDVMRSQLNVLEREKEVSKVETESLRGQVESFTQLESSFSQDQTKYQSELSELSSKLSQTSAQVSELQQKLKNAKQQLSRATKDKQDSLAQVELQVTEIDRYKKENQQMKEQFDSAVKLMETKSIEQTAVLAQVTLDISQKDSALVSLKEQILGQKRHVSELEEKVAKVSADHKVSSERCRLLEQEKQLLKQRLSDLSTECSHLEQTLSESLSEKESLQLQQQTILSSVQEHEHRTFNLTHQIGQLAREKEFLEGQTRDLSKQLVTSEQRSLSLGSEVNSLKLQSKEVQTWEREKQALLDDRKTLELDKSTLQSNEASHQSQISQLQAVVDQLQKELQESHLECESSQQSKQDNGSTNNAAMEELQKRYTALQEMHTAETFRFQEALKEENEKRETAEKSLQVLKGEVIIGIEDSTLGISGHINQPQTYMDYIEASKVWFQRFIKNPNVVLMRLYRATPQTKLFFLAYFVFLHLMIFYMFLF